MDRALVKRLRDSDSDSEKEEESSSSSQSRKPSTDKPTDILTTVKTPEAQVSRPLTFNRVPYAVQ